MKIPDTTKNQRFYLAVSSEEALSSSDSLQKARDCIKRLRVQAKKDTQCKTDLKRVKYIIETGPSEDDRQEHPLKPEKGRMSRKIRQGLLDTGDVDPDDCDEEDDFKLRTWHPDRLKTMGTRGGLVKNECFDDEVIGIFREWGIDKVHLLFVPGGDRWYVASMAVESKDVNRAEQITGLVNSKKGSLENDGDGPIFWRSG